MKYPNITLENENADKMYSEKKINNRYAKPITMMKTQMKIKRRVQFLVCVPPPCFYTVSDAKPDAKENSLRDGYSFFFS